MTDLRAIQAEITTLRVDTIVNAANSSLLGGGVDGSVHRAAGPGLRQECQALRGCKVGDAKLTAGHNLPARFVIHTVGPVWRGGAAGAPELLSSCYRRSIEVAAAAGVRSLAFPSISTGVYGYPIELAAAGAVSTLRSVLPLYPEIAEVTFCCFSSADLAVYEAALNAPH